MLELTEEEGRSAGRLDTFGEVTHMSMPPSRKSMGSAGSSSLASAIF